MTYFKDGSTVGECYRPACEKKDMTQAEADEYFEALVNYCVRQDIDMKRPKAEAIQRANLGYYAGYYDNATRERVERLFKCSHPIFGGISTYGTPSAEVALEIGKKIGAKNA